MVDYDITEALIARIKAECPGFKNVEEAWFSDPPDDYHEDTPSALPYLAEDTPGEVDLTQRQSASQVYGVFLVCEIGTELRAQRHELRQALYGWQPAGTSGVMHYHGGQMAEIRGLYVYWRDFWRIDTPNALTASRTVTI